MQVSTYRSINRIRRTTSRTRTNHRWLETFLEKNTVDLHAVTHHVYPGITLDNWNQSSVLDRPLSDISWYAPIVEKTSFRMWYVECSLDGRKRSSRNTYFFSKSGVARKDHMEVEMTVRAVLDHLRVESLRHRFGTPTIWH